MHREMQSVSEARTMRGSDFSGSMNREVATMLMERNSSRPNENAMGQHGKRPADLGFPKLDIGSCDGHPGCISQNNWKPDRERKTEQGRAWDPIAKVQRGKPLETEPDGTYKARKGDCLEHIAERLAKKEGNKNPDKDAVKDAMRRIIEANPILRCNPDRINEGQRLRIPDKNRDVCQAPQDRPALRPPVERPQPLPQRPQEKPHCPRSEREQTTPRAPERDKPTTQAPDRPRPLPAKPVDIPVPHRPEQKPAIVLPEKPVCPPRIIKPFDPGLNPWAKEKPSCEKPQPMELYIKTKTIHY